MLYYVRLQIKRVYGKEREKKRKTGTPIDGKIGSEAENRGLSTHSIKPIRKVLEDLNCNLNFNLRRVRLHKLPVVRAEWRATNSRVQHNGHLLEIHVEKEVLPLRGERVRQMH